MLYTYIDVMFRYQKDVADVVLLLASLDLAGFLLAVTDETYYNFNTSISLQKNFLEGMGVAVNMDISWF